VYDGAMLTVLLLLAASPEVDAVVADVKSQQKDLKLDTWAASLESARGALLKAGFQVTVETAASPALGWTPRVAGARLIVTDTSRTTTAAPYAELRKEPAKPANPRLTVSVMPLVKLRARVDMMSRMQPAEVLGALPGAVVFVMQPPQGGDVDDGKLYEAVRTTLFPSGKGITVKQTQNGGTAELEINP
jgi:hypothetical protein